LIIKIYACLDSVGFTKYFLVEIRFGGDCKMTNLNPSMREHLDRMAYIAKDHWRRFESDEEHQDRVECAELRVNWFFEDATEGQSAAYQRALRTVSGIHTPRAELFREAALSAFHIATADTRKLVEESFAEILRDGELSEETAARWDALPAFADAVAA
jgi:hypothetical protein